jgi:hypothetical protein
MGKPAMKDLCDAIAKALGAVSDGDGGGPNKNSRTLRTAPGPLCGHGWRRRFRPVWSRLGRLAGQR